MGSSLLRETEFVTVNGVRLTGACGPNSAGGAARRSFQNDLYTTAHVYQRMRTLGLCDANGVSNPDGLVAYLKQAGLGPVYSGWQAVGWDFQGWLMSSASRDAAHAGHPLVLELGYGQALRDAISGKGENAANLRYHFIAPLECHPGGYSKRANRTLDAGWWTADGDNFAVGNVLQFYTLATLKAAQPRCAIVVPRHTSMSWLDAADAPSAAPVATIAKPAWTWNADGSGKDSAGHWVGPDSGAAIRNPANGIANVPALTPLTYTDSLHAFLIFADGHVLRYDRSMRKATVGLGGDLALQYRSQNQALTTQVKQLQAALTAAQSGASDSAFRLQVQQIASDLAALAA